MKTIERLNISTEPVRCIALNNVNEFSTKTQLSGDDYDLIYKQGFEFIYYNEFEGYVYRRRSCLEEKN